jgi:cytochrome oxidase Cu insertion factor (SCO1/SenC/PrrC family)
MKTKKEDLEDLIKEVDLFVLDTEIKLKNQGVNEGDYCILITTDGVTIRTYKSIQRFKERVIEDTQHLDFYSINWQVVSFD